MNKETIVNIAKRIAEEKHAGQFRRDGKTPYMNHINDVVRRLDGERDEIIATAYLHDVIEDTDVTSKFLLDQGVPFAVVEAVIVLTKTKDKSYFNYITQVKANEIARKVKIQDMNSNLSDAPTPRQIQKYTQGLRILTEE